MRVTIETDAEQVQVIVEGRQQSTPATTQDALKAAYLSGCHRAFNREAFERAVALRQQFFNGLRAGR